MHCIETIKAFTDNYIWCIHDKINAVVVDPGDAMVVTEYLSNNALKLCAIMVTHHHQDHIGGVSQLKELYSNVEIYSAIPKIATNLIKVNDIIKIAMLDNLSFNVIQVPGHTLDHIMFYGNNMLFCGDTLFSSGCGRVFEGTYKQMYQSLMKINALDEETLVYAAHEYTVKNIEFALSIEPDNIDLVNRYHEWLYLEAMILSISALTVEASLFAIFLMMVYFVRISTRVNKYDF